MTELATFVSELLSHRKALVEESSGGLEAVLPADLAQTLGTPEHVKLSWDQREGSFLLSRDSDLFAKLQNVLLTSGGLCGVTLDAPELRLDKMENKLLERVALDNAVYHLESRQRESVSYCLSYFKYTASSDDRQTGVMAALINEANLSVRGTSAVIPDVLLDAEVASPDPSGTRPRTEVVKALDLAQKRMVAKELDPFIKSLEKRLQREIQRVRAYYGALLDEILKRSRKQGTSEEEEAKAQSKTRAVEAELERKTQDLTGKYSLNIAIEPISFIRIQTETPVFRILLKRRKQTRPFGLAYNPVVKALDILPCEACFLPQGSYSLCDERLHIVCSRCFERCEACGKPYCGACFEGRCPRCKRRASGPEEPRL